MLSRALEQSKPGCRVQAGSGVGKGCLFSLHQFGFNNKCHTCRFEAFRLGALSVAGDQKSKSGFSEVLGALLSLESWVKVSGGFLMEEAKECINHFVAFLNSL